MKANRLGIGVSIVGLLLLAWTTAAQEPKTTTEKLKEKASNAAGAVKKGVASAEEGVKEQYARAKVAIHNMEVQHRVYARLHWDKALTASKIELSMVNEGVATLTGTVPDAKAKAKAIQLANDTVGVTQVIDRMTIGTPATPASTKP
jgi:osmotically-inducible protein OsmY